MQLLLCHSLYLEQLEMQDIRQKGDIYEGSYDPETDPERDWKKPAVAYFIFYKMLPNVK